MSTNPNQSESFHDPKSFERIYKLYSKKLLKICFYYTGNQQESLEMVQEIFESLWQRKDTLTISSPMENYLVRAAKLKSFKYIRDRVALEKSTMSITEEACVANCTEHAILYNQLKDRVDFLIDTLPCQCKNVFKLSREQGLSNKEIASTLLISEKAVEYHITKALALLKNNLAEYK